MLIQTHALISYGRRLFPVRHCWQWNLHKNIPLKKVFLVLSFVFVFVCWYKHKHWCLMASGYFLSDISTIGFAKGICICIYLYLYLYLWNCICICVFVFVFINVFVFVLTLIQTHALMSYGRRLFPVRQCWQLQSMIPIPLLWMNKKQNKRRDLYLPSINPPFMDE